MKKSLNTFLIALLVACITTPASAIEMPIPGINFRPNFKDLKSFQTRKFERVIRQRFDYSCGSAALATMLTVHYGKRISEAEVIREMIKVGDQAKIQKEGFSLLDMKNYLQSLGYEADGFRSPLSKLQQVGIPAIALLNINNYLHFVLVKGMNEREILVGDPTLGLKIMKKEDFEKAWNGILFVITSHKDIGRANFNHPDDWEYISKTAMNSYSSYGISLSSFTVNTSLTPNYY